jgi:hypothetical protein
LCLKWLISIQFWKIQRSTVRRRRPGLKEFVFRLTDTTRVHSEFCWKFYNTFSVFPNLLMGTVAHFNKRCQYCESRLPKWICACLHFRRYVGAT